MGVCASLVEGLVGGACFFSSPTVTVGLGHVTLGHVARVM